MRFEWDPAKAADNVARHGVSFEEAATVFVRRRAICHLRYLDKRPSSRDAHTERGDTIRIISARPATAGERKIYEEDE